MKVKVLSEIRIMPQLIFIITMTLFCLGHYSFAQKSYEEIERRGVVIYPSDITSIGAKKWVEMAHNAGLNVIGLHSDTRLETLPKLKSFLKSKEGKIFLAECLKHNIDVEYEQHILMELLPRDLFEKHPEFFRVDKEGKTKW